MTTKTIKLSDPILRHFTDEQLQRLNRRELIVLARGEQKIRVEYEKFIAELQQRQLALESLNEELKERVLAVEGSLCRIRSMMFEPSSERSPATSPNGGGCRGSSNDGKKDPVKKLPSERYPDAEIIEKHITLEKPPACKCCGNEMTDSGMVETSEQLSIIPKKVMIIRENRHKYRCSKCHGDIVTTPKLPRIIPAGSYSDEMIIDATLSKYCDLIPMERYCQILKRQGFPGVPPQSLIAASFKLAEFLLSVYERIKQETLTTEVLLADETPHRMLEGDKRTNWFLWGFSNKTSCFYECHDTRSGDVASAVLGASSATVLLTDVYSGYKKAVREANEQRVISGLPLLAMAYCNSHARREFIPMETAPEAQHMLLHYKEIYKLEKESKDKTHEDRLAARSAMGPYFACMKEHCTRLQDTVSSKSSLGKAFNYFLNNYDGLTQCLTNPNIPLDNNASERLLRSHVVGRKTWYGTHSKDGARAAAIHFTLVESCKINGVNPRAYYREAIRRLHAHEPIIAPSAMAREPQPLTPSNSS
jgi:transposase